MLSRWTSEHHLKQADAARILMVSRLRVSDVMNKKTTKFTIDTLVEMLSRIGKPVRLPAHSCQLFDVIKEGHFIVAFTNN